MRCKHLWLTALTTSAALVAAPDASGEVVALYDFSEFTTEQADNYENVESHSPYQNHASSSLASEQGLANGGLAILVAHTTRDSTSVELGANALLFGPGSVPTTDSPSADTGYLGTTITADTAIELTDFSFNLGTSAGENTNASGITTVETYAQLFYSLDGGETFNALGDLHASIADNADNEGAFTGIEPYAVDLSALDPLNAGDSIEFRLAFGNNRGAGTESMGHYLDNVTVSAVPEPASLALLGLGGLAMLGRRRRH